MIWLRKRMIAEHTVKIVADSECVCMHDEYLWIYCVIYTSAVLMEVVRKLSRFWFACKQKQKDPGMPDSDK